MKAYGHRMRELKRVLGRNQMGIRRGNIDRPRLKYGVVYCFFHLHGRGSCQQLYQCTFVGRAEVLHYNYAAAEIFWKALQHLGEGKETAGRSANGHSVKLRSRKALRLS